MEITQSFALPKYSIDELNYLMMSFRRHLDSYIKEILTKHMANYAISAIDLSFLEESDRRLFPKLNNHIAIKDNFEQSPIFTAYQIIYDEERAILNGDDAKRKHDYSCDIVVFPLHDKLLFMLFFQQPGYMEIFKSVFSEATPYDYSSKQGQPDDITPKEWKQREQDWTKATYTGVPSLDGMTFKCYTHLPRIGPSSVLAYIKDKITLSKRVNSIANRLIVLHAYHAIVSGEKKIFGSSSDYDKALVYFESPEGQKEYEQRRDALFKTLIHPSDMSEEMLVSPVRDALNFKSGQ